MPKRRSQPPRTGQPEQSPEAFARFLSRIQRRTGAMVNLTTGELQERIRPAETFKPEVASLNVGSMKGADRVNF